VLELVAIPITVFPEMGEFKYYLIAYLFFCSSKEVMMKYYGKIKQNMIVWSETACQGLFSINDKELL
jgi:hypothetical protein